MYEILVLHYSVLGAVPHAVFKIQKKKIKHNVEATPSSHYKESNFHSVGPKR
jgi:hypothetical protein